MVCSEHAATLLQKHHITKLCGVFLICVLLIFQNRRPTALQPSDPCFWLMLHITEESLLVNPEVQSGCAGVLVASDCYRESPAVQHSVIYRYMVRLFKTGLLLLLRQIPLHVGETSLGKH